MAQQPVTQGLNWGQIRAILNENSTDVEQRLAQIETGGVQIISGVGMPGNDDGNEGDYYIDSAGYNIYGPKGNSGWPAGVSMSGFNPSGAWASGSNYAINDVVHHQNSLWVALVDNVGVEPRDLADEWDILARGDFFRGDWASGTVYRIYHTVRYSGNVYRALTTEFTSTVSPDTDTGNWALISTKGDKGDTGDTGPTGSTGAPGLVHTGTYNPATAYAVNNSVVFRSKLWRRKIVDVAGVIPSLSNAATWEKIAGSLHYLETLWAQGTAYYVDDIVSHSDGNKYRAKTDHTATATPPSSDTVNYELFLTKGATGNTGPQGEQGEQGIPGLPGTPGAGLAPGFIIAYGDDSTPAGWLHCNGQPVSRTTYADLFALLGTTWGSGDGETTFNVPDLRGRTLVGDGTGGGLTPRTVGQGGGEEEHALTAGENGPHTHDFKYTQNNRSTGGGQGDRVTNLADTGGSTKTTLSSGSGEAHENMPPFSVIRYLIKV